MKRKYKIRIFVLGLPRLFKDMARWLFIVFSIASLCLMVKEPENIDIESYLTVITFTLLAIYFKDGNQ